MTTIESGRSIRLVTEVPGPRSKEIVARREAATPPGAAKLTQLAVERAEGAVVIDVDGNHLLDLAGVDQRVRNGVEALLDLDSRQGELLLHHGEDSIEQLDDARRRQRPRLAIDPDHRTHHPTPAACPAGAAKRSMVKGRAAP